MLGFGFNKDKVRANADKFVQQGKLQNAIAEYDKILKTVRKEVKENKLKTAGAKFIKASNALNATYNELKAVEQPAEDAAKLTKWLGDRPIRLISVPSSRKAEAEFLFSEAAIVEVRTPNLAAHGPSPAE